MLFKLLPAKSNHKKVTCSRVVEITDFHDA